MSSEFLIQKGTDGVCNMGKSSIVLDSASAGIDELLTGLKGPRFDNCRLPWLFHYWSSFGLAYQWRAEHTRLLLFTAKFMLLNLPQVWCAPNIKVPSIQSLDGNDTLIRKYHPTWVTELNRHVVHTWLRKGFVENNIVVLTDVLLVSCTETRKQAISPSPVSLKWEFPKSVIGLVGDFLSACENKNYPFAP